MSIIMKVKLTADQERAKNLIAEWYLHTDDQVFVLSGYAGTGKTFLIDYLVKEVLKLKVGSENSPLLAMFDRTHAQISFNESISFPF